MATVSAYKDEQKRPGRSFSTVAVLIIVLGIVAAISVREPVLQWLSIFIADRSEYRTIEIASKIYILTACLISCLYYDRTKNRSELLLSVLFLLWVFALYFGESNFIDGKLRPLTAAVMVPLLCYGLIKCRLWSVLLIFALAIGMLGTGSVIDYFHDLETPPAGMTGESVIWFHVLAELEEDSDLVAAGLLLFAMVLLAAKELGDLVAGHRKAVALIAAAILLVAIGNSFSHWQYAISQLHATLALVLAWFGWLLLIYANERLLPKERRLKLVYPVVLYAVLFAFFVFLPTVYRMQNGYAALLLYGTLAIAGGFWLYRHHPVCGWFGTKRSGEGRQKSAVRRF